MTNKKLTPEQELAVKNNHAEITRQLDKHFNGNEKDKKMAFGNVETAFNNLVKANSGK